MSLSEDLLKHRIGDNLAVCDEARYRSPPDCHGPRPVGGLAMTRWQGVSPGFTPPLEPAPTLGR